MSGRTVVRIVLVLVIALGAVALGVSAYNAGVTAGLAAGSESPGTVAPILYPYAGWGWHGAFGFFGFLGFLFFLFLLFALIRAATWGGGRRGWGGYGRWGGGPGGPGGQGPERWHEHEGLRELHRKLHESEGQPDAGGTSGRPT